MIGVPVKRSRLPIVHAETDKELRNKLRGKPVSCSKGCNACCHQLVNVFYLEAAEAVREAQRKGFSIDRMKLDEDAKRLAKMDPWSDADRVTWFARKSPCIFLTDEGCGVYDARPTQCRLTHVKSDPKNCADPKGTVEVYDVRDIAQRSYARTVFNHTRTMTVPVMGPLPIMVRDILNGIPPSDIAKNAGCTDYNRRQWERAQEEQERVHASA